MILMLTVAAALVSLVLVLGALLMIGSQPSKPPASEPVSVSAPSPAKSPAKKAASPPSSSKTKKAACQKAGSFGSLPSWAKQGTVLGPTLGLYEQNSETAKGADDCFDFLLYGDSITAFLTRDPAVLKKHFGDKKAAALGVGGNTVEQLAWRIMSGNEAPARAPKVVAFNIGVNNTTRSQGAQVTTDHMETLLRWWQKAYPSTTLVLMALLPTSRPDRKVAETNRQYKALASKLGIVFAECGQDMDADDTTLYSDGLHPTAAGHDVVLKCLRKIVDRYL